MGVTLCTSTDVNVRDREPHEMCAPHGLTACLLIGLWCGLRGTRACVCVLRSQSAQDSSHFGRNQQRSGSSARANTGARGRHAIESQSGRSRRGTLVRHASSPASRSPIHPLPFLHFISTHISAFVPACFSVAHALFRAFICTLETARLSLVSPLRCAWLCFAAP